jgi:hypothetical protein
MPIVWSFFFSNKTHIFKCFMHFYISIPLYQQNSNKKRYVNDIFELSPMHCKKLNVYNFRPSTPIFDLDLGFQRHMSWPFFYVYWLELRGDCWNLCNSWPSLFKLSFHNLKRNKNVFNEIYFFNFTSYDNKLNSLLP